MLRLNISVYQNRDENGKFKISYSCGLRVPKSRQCDASGVLGSRFSCVYLPFQLFLFTQDYLLQGTRRFGELGGKQWKTNPTRGSIYPILFSIYVHFRHFNISHIQSLEDEAPACIISLS